MIPDESEIVDAVTRAECYNLMYEAICQLPGQSRQILELVLEGKTAKDIAELLEISVNSIKTLKYRALNKLKNRFGILVLIIFNIFS